MMNHLTEEQFEDLIHVRKSMSPHLKYCNECRSRVIEDKALANRLHSAFMKTKPCKKLEKEILHQLNLQSEKNIHINEKHLTLRIFFQRQAWLKVISAAAILIIAAHLILTIVGPSTAFASKAQLINIHKDNLAENHKFHSQSNSEKIAAYFRRELGVSPIILRSERGQSLRGCCLHRFKNQVVGSYVVQIQEVMISIVAVREHPKSLGMERTFRQGKHFFWAGSHDRYKFVILQIGQYSYCAVGETSEAYLTQLLKQIISD